MNTVENCGELSNNQIIFFSEEFKALKKQIVNFYTCTKNYKDKFVQELNQITEIMNQQQEAEELKKYQEEVSKGNSLPLMLTKSKSKNEEKKGFLEKIGITNSKKKK
jgi:ABC-type hemin transport system substrate-binding protein